MPEASAAPELPAAKSLPEPSTTIVARKTQGLLKPDGISGARVVTFGKNRALNLIEPVIREEDRHHRMAPILSGDAQLPAAMPAHASRDVQADFARLPQQIDRLVDSACLVEGGAGKINHCDAENSGPWRTE